MDIVLLELIDKTLANASFIAGALQVPVGHSLIESQQSIELLSLSEASDIAVMLCPMAACMSSSLSVDDMSIVDISIEQCALTAITD